MGEDGHRRLLEAIAGRRGAVAISGYVCPLYDEALRGWERITFDMPNHAGRGREKRWRAEVLWIR